MSGRAREKTRAAPAPTAQPVAPPSRAEWVVPALVALLSVAAFLPALNAGFVSWDDDRNFTDNLHYRGLGAPQLKWMWTTFHMGHYVPLSWMTLGLDYVAWGMSPRGYHATSLVLHALNAMLVYLVARRVLELVAAPAPGRDARSLTFGAACAALIFAVHPLRAESVVWITERRDVLSGCFFTLTILCYLRASEPAAVRRWYWLAVAVFAAGMLSKATVMTVPAVLLLLNVVPLRRLPAAGGWLGAQAWRVYLEVLPFGLLAVGTASLSIVALDPPDQLTLAGKIAASAYSLAFYTVKTLVPTGLAPLYEIPKPLDPMAAAYLAAYGAVIASAAAAWTLRKRNPAVVAAIVAFVLILLPTIGFVQNGPQIAADRYTYHAAPALAILAGGLITAGVGLWPVAVRAAAVAAVLALTAATWRQSGIWKTSETLWARVLAVDPRSSIAHVGLAAEFARQDRLAEAVDHYARAVAIDPDYAEGHNNMGVALVRLGRIDEGVDHYRRSLTIKPAYDEPYSNWGVVLARRGDLPGAFANFQRALQIKPENPDAHINWGNALVRMDSTAAAIEHYRAAIALRPDNADAHLNWGVALARRGDLSGAAELFRLTLRLRPGDAEATLYLERARQPSTAPSTSPTPPGSPRSRPR